MSEKRRKIIEIVTLFSEMFDKKISDSYMEMYIRTLQKYPIEKIEQAANYIIKTKTFNKFPLPAEFIEQIDPPEQAQVKSNKAWRTVLDAIEIHGYVATVKFVDSAITQTILAMASTWPEFCNRTRCDDTEFKWLQKEFEQRYAAYAKMGTLRNEVLIGWVDAENGEQNPAPILIGEPERKLIAEKQD